MRCTRYVRSEPEVRKHLRNVYNVTGLCVTCCVLGACLPACEYTSLVSLIVCI